MDKTWFKIFFSPFCSIYGTGYISVLYLAQAAITVLYCICKSCTCWAKLGASHRYTVSHTVHAAAIGTSYYFCTEPDDILMISSKNMCWSRFISMVVSCSVVWDMRHTSMALYFYGASKKSLHKPKATSGDMLFKIIYGFNYYLQILCLQLLPKTHLNF